MMKHARLALAVLALTVASVVNAATFNLFQPANGILVGNPSTYVTTAATSSNVISLWSGTCNSTTFLRGDGSCQIVTSVSPANPTATVGLTAVNGSAGTYMRSDGAPALSQSIVPTWTGLHTFDTAPLMQSTANFLTFKETDAAANRGRWRWEGSGGNLLLRSVNDAGTGIMTALQVTQDSGTGNIDSINFSTTIGTLTVNAQPVCLANGTDCPVSPSNVAFLDQQNTFLYAANSLASQAFINTDTGTLAANELDVANSLNTLQLGITGTNYSGSRLTGGPSGQSTYINTNAAIPLTLGTNNNARLSIGSGGDWSVGGGVGTSGQVLTSGGAGASPTWTTVSASPGGSTTQVQYNNAGAFAGDAGMTYNAGTDTLSVGSATITTAATVGGQNVCLANGTNCPTGGSSLPVRSISTTDNTQASDCGKVILFTGAGSQTFTLDADPAVNCVLTFINNGSAATSLAASGTLTWFNGSGTNNTGTRTIQVGGVVTATVLSSAGSWQIWGAGISL